jgi:hypothetical protein
MINIAMGLVFLSLGFLAANFYARMVQSRRETMAKLISTFAVRHPQADRETTKGLQQKLDDLIALGRKFRTLSNGRKGKLTQL